MKLLLWILQGGGDTDRISVPTVLRNAFSVFFANLEIALVIALISGGVGFWLTDMIGTSAVEGQDIRDPKMQLIAATLVQSALLCFWALVVGAWAAPAQIYLWVQREKGLPATLAGAVNFGLNRWSRVAFAHFRAYLAVVLGNIIVVPGIIFGIQFAFVDAIATLDAKEKHPLRRSARLTSVRRRAIVGTMLVFLFGWWLWFQLGLVFFLPSLPVWGKVALGTIDHLVLVLVDLCMVQFYLDLFRKAAPVAESALATTAKSSMRRLSDGFSRRVSPRAAADALTRLRWAKSPNRDAQRWRTDRPHPTNHCWSLAPNTPRSRRPRRAAPGACRPDCEPWPPHTTATRPMATPSETTPPLAAAQRRRWRRPRSRPSRRAAPLRSAQRLDPR
ncbi:MAG: hypothetical protein EXR71_04575 [Myxococcales bacterium]|nr:hypothetical protein [Myxococcales bacterium]